MNTYNGKPFLIIDAKTYNIDQATSLLKAVGLDLHGAVTDILSVEDIDLLRKSVGTFSSEEVTIESLHIFADDSLSIFELANQDFLRLVYHTVAQFDVEIYFG